MKHINCTFGETLISNLSMNKLNFNDFVVVNGKKYYADGGNTNEMNSVNIIDPKKIDKYMQNNGNRGTNWGAKRIVLPYNERKSNEYGRKLFESYPQEIQNAIIDQRLKWADYLKSQYNEDDLKNNYGISLDDYINDDTFSNESTEKVNGLMYKNFPYVIRGNENGQNDRIKSGDNIFYAMLSTADNPSATHYNKDEWDFLGKKGFDKYRTDSNKSYTRSVLDNSVVYNFYDYDNNGNNIKKPITLIYDSDDKKWKYYANDPRSINAQKYHIGDFTDKMDYNTFSDDSMRNGTLKGNGYPIVLGNSKGITFKPNNVINGINISDYWKPSEKQQSNAYGGRTSRLYADGGSMGQIPMGEQEDYNMIDAGGSHEQNPMGGVPYGMNQDGSQNMVEEGEVSVGDNVFSDRSSLSPELCQQLGMPEGTSPAQAMQQIEQLYEQGQISDEEYQEIQNIIFEDQEMQKQNVGGSYQQGQVGGEGTEGLDPSMLGMQQDSMQEPIGQSQMQAPTEGIDPTQLGVPMAFGGRRRYYCR